MNRSTLKFLFNPSVPMPEVEATLRLAVLAVESLHGTDRVQLETNASINRGDRCCLVDATTEVGRTLAAIFSGYVRREFGGEAVQIVAATAEQAPQRGSV